MENSCVPSVASGRAERVFNSWQFVCVADIKYLSPTA